MQSLTATLLAAQRQMGDALCKLVLTFGATTKTYDIFSTANRILDVSHKEQEWSQTAQITVDNRDGNLTALKLQGYKGVISNGYKTTSDEYSAVAPLTVIAQKADTVQGDKVVTFSLAGLFNLWGEQEATEAYTPDDDVTDTVKTILDAIATPTLDCFSDYPAHTITYDTNNYDDGIIDTFTPKDYFSIAKGESRLSAFKKALAYTKCKALVKNDSGTATIHIYVPTIEGDTWLASTAYSLLDYVQPTTATNLFAYRCTTAGTSHSSEPTWPTIAGGTVTEGGGSSLVWTAVAFDYEYNDAEGLTYHDFFSKSVRTRVVLPNEVVVMNHPDHEDSYTGNATDAASYAAMNNQYYTETIYARPANNAQCTLMAKARLQRYQIAAEKGHGVAPLNCGQEVMDYVKITDSVASDLRIGNVGYIHRWYSYSEKQPTRFGMEFRFGTLETFGLAGTVPPKPISIDIVTEGVERSFQSLVDEINYLRDELANAATIDDFNRMAAVVNFLLDRAEKVPKFHVTQQLIIPVKD